MSGPPRNPGVLRLPEYEPGQDELWDRLGKEWQAIDGAVEGTRIYVTWRKHEDGRSVLDGICIKGVITGEMLRAIPVGRLAHTPDAVPFDVADLERLRRRKGEPPEEFANRVAWYYRVFTQITPHPAKAISEHSHVPITTVRGWIHEARARGKLPPGTRGRAG